MKKFLFSLLALLAVVARSSDVVASPSISIPNGCIQFSVGQGTGCAWMCNYCATSLGTNNYYFTDNVCTYQQGQGCVGNPTAGKTYTCCAASEASGKEL